jgi:hypothetical protein
MNLRASVECQTLAACGHGFGDGAVFANRAPLRFEQTLDEKCNSTTLVDGYSTLIK